MKALRRTQRPPQSCQFGRSRDRCELAGGSDWKCLDRGKRKNERRKGGVYARSIAITIYIAFWYSILSILTMTPDHSLLCSTTYWLSLTFNCSTSSSDVLYEIVRFVDSHLDMKKKRKKVVRIWSGRGVRCERGVTKTNIELLRLKLWINFDDESRAFGATISWPSTRRNVVEKRPKSFTNKTCGRYRNTLQSESIRNEMRDVDVNGLSPDHLS